MGNRVVTTERKDGMLDHAEGKRASWKVTTKLGPCHVRSDTGHPCPRRAVVKIRGIPFCERCAREQEAYFAIGEVTQGL